MTAKDIMIKHKLLTPIASDEEVVYVLVDLRRGLKRGTLTQDGKDCVAELDAHGMFSSQRAVGVKGKV